MDDERHDPGFTRRWVGRLPDVMSRALVAGTGALFLTEEGIRNLVSEMKLPGDAVRQLLQQADSTKKDLFRFVGQEIRSFLEQSNLSQELVKVLAGITVNIQTTISFEPNAAGGLTPKMDNQFQTKGTPSAEPDSDEDPPESAEVPVPSSPPEERHAAGKRGAPDPPVREPSED